MSKAFTKEDDLETSAPEPDEADAHADLQSAGGKNYITPEGAEKLREELRALVTVERPEVVRVVSWAAGNGDRSENGDYIYGKKRLREIDRRIRFLNKRLDAVEVIDPRTQTQRDRVLFGATVTYQTEAGDSKTVRIVGIDESNGSRGWVSWISPIARALLQSKVGDAVLLRTPRGEEELEVTAIEYPKA